MILLFVCKISVGIEITELFATNARIIIWKMSFPNEWQLHLCNNFSAVRNVCGGGISTNTNNSLSRHLQYLEHGTENLLLFMLISFGNNSGLLFLYPNIY